MEEIEKVDERGLPVVEGLSSEEIRAGFRLFFSNKHEDALRFFAQHEHRLPLFAMGRAAITFAHAVVSFEDEDIANAVEAMNKAADLVKQYVNEEGTLASWGRWLVGSKKERKSSVHVHLEVMLAECKLLSACLQFFEEGILDKLKAGWGMRAAWQQYARIAKENPIEGGKDHLDLETRCGIQYGVGIFNLVCSILPPRVMRVASIFGFPSSRSVALEALGQVHAAESVRAPLASLSLLLHHVGLQSAFGSGKLRHMDEAEKIVEECLARHPDGGLFLLVQGRLCRLKRNVNEGIAIYKRVEALKLGWRQLNDLVSYEMGWSHLSLLQYEKALEYFLALQDNQWSKGFYKYMIGICTLALGRHEEGMALLAGVQPLCVRKFNGRLIPMEEYVIRKTKLAADGADTSLAVLEIMYLWNTFTQMPTDRLETVMSIASDWLHKHAAPSSAGTPNSHGKAHRQHHHHDHHHAHTPSHPPAPATADSEAVARLVLAAAQAQHGQLDAAAASLDLVDALVPHIKSDTFVGPFAAYERSVILGLRNAPRAERQAALAACLGNGADFNFSNRLQFRCHLALMEVQQEGMV